MPLTRRTALGALLCGAAQAQPLPGVGTPPELATELPGARLQGSGRLRVWGLHVYDARLWAGTRPVGDDWATLPFALELIYARSFEGSQIAERSLTEMGRQGGFDEATAERWLGTLKALLPDVKAGDRLCGINQAGRGARFFFNAGLRGELREAELIRVFFGIWLSPRTSEPALRQALLGRAP